MQEPEKAKLEFGDIVTSQASVREVADKIHAVSEQVLFHWKSFPVVLPPSIVDNKAVCLKELFVLPTFDELDALTTDCKGNTKYLTHNQLELIKRKGQFAVPSINFPGQNHTWKLNSLFQKGCDTAREEYLDGLALALRFPTVYVPQLINGDIISFKSSLRGLKVNLIELFDLLFGYGKVYASNLERRIADERYKYLVAELKCKGDGARQIGRYVRNQANKAMREKVIMATSYPHPQIPYRFLTPLSMDIDLRLFDRDLFRKITPSLGRLLEKSARGWFLTYREKVISELKSKKMTDSEIEMEANIMIMDEFLNRAYDAIRTCPEITSVASDIDRLLIEQAQAYVLLHRAVDEVSIKLEFKLMETKKFVLGAYPTLSRDSAWMRMRMRNAQIKFSEENRWLPHEIALELFKQHYLNQHSYFLARDLVFMRDTEPVLRKELETDKKPCRTFEWKITIWRPKNYVVSRTLHGQTEVIPTVVSQTPTSITGPRTDPYHPVYTVKRVNCLQSTSTSLWRLQNFFFRTVTWLLNVMYILGYVVPWCSPVSVRAVFYKGPFTTDLELSQVNGTLCPKKSSQTSTLTSRLIHIWRHISKARTRFEAQPDTQFLGRGLSRTWNRIWNYFFKGFCSSFLLILLFPVSSILVCLLSVTLAGTAPFWMPMVTLGFHALCILVYDFDTPSQDRPKLFSVFYTLGCLIVQGVLQPIVCLVTAFILCPLLCSVISLWTVGNYGLRLAWDSFMFHSLIKPKGRLPSGNSWIVKRVFGPGLENDFYFEITMEQALIAFRARLETEELNIFYQKTNQLISKPQSEYKTFFQACFTPFSGKLLETEGPYRDLIRETIVLRTSLDDKVMKRRRDLETGLNVATRSRIRMRKPQLERMLRFACKMAQTFYHDRIFSRFGCAEEVVNYWESRGLELDDWMNLCILLFTEIFCQDFLTPLDDLDVCFGLEMTMKARPLSEMFLTYVEDDCWTGDVVTMSKVKYQIHSPYLDVSSFNPMARSPQMDNMLIPLPILHPAFISVIIHNRETDNPFSMDNPICQAILKALQDSGPMLNQECITLNNVDESLSSSEGDSPSEGTQEDMIGVDSPSPLCSQIPIPRSQSHLDSVAVTIAGGKNIMIGSGPQHSSKASLASPEEINLDDVVLSAFGTSV